MGNASNQMTQNVNRATTATLYHLQLLIPKLDGHKYSAGSAENRGLGFVLIGETKCCTLVGHNMLFSPMAWVKIELKFKPVKSQQ